MPNAWLRADCPGARFSASHGRSCRRRSDLGIRLRGEPMDDALPTTRSALTSTHADVKQVVVKQVVVLMQENRSFDH